MAWPTSPPSYSRGTLLNPTTGSALDLGVITRERIECQFGLWTKALPFTSTRGAIGTSPFGKVREIILEGHKAGTMVQIEQFIKGIEDWANVALELADGHYYFPFFHSQQDGYKEDLNELTTYTSTYSGASTPTQRYKYTVLADTFSIEYDEEMPNRVEYLLILREVSAIDLFDDEEPAA